jgi:nucleotide-binding universal stress UspA family protein
MYRTILIPVDGSKRAEAILHFVENLGQIDIAKVILLKVEEEPLLLERDEVIDLEAYKEKLEQQARRSNDYLTSLQRQLGAKGIEAVTRLAYGTVVKAILKVAAEIEADLIAIATHGLTGSHRVSYGSVTAGVLQAADIPILLIRSGNDEES